MNADEKAIIIRRLKKAKANCVYYMDTSWEREAFEVYYNLRALARDLGVEL